MFASGRLMAAPGALEKLQANGRKPLEFFARHLSGDWGDVSPEDCQANDAASAQGARILSIYHLDDGTKVWIITEADRSSTCILLPDEY